MATTKKTTSKKSTKTKKKLVIVESPSKAKTIEKYLGSTYKVVASLGHVRDLPKSQMGVDIEHDYQPKYINIRGKGPLIKELRKDVKNSKAVYLATDPDREGEAIAWHLKHTLDLDEAELNRVTFNEITKDAVKEAFNNPRKINQDLVDAQQARRILDRLVGYSISPILWKKVKRGLSAGRVQNIALGFIIDREKEIQAFQPEEYWTIDAEFAKAKSKFKASFYGVDGKKLKLEENAVVQDVLSKINKDEAFTITDVIKKESKKNPPLPFRTSTLQQTANTQLNFRTQRTMMAAQQLYEGINLGRGIGQVGLITYMRTDSTRISETAKNDAANFITENYGSQYLSQQAAKKEKLPEGAQDAHEGIRPTNVNYTPESIKEKLTPDQYRLYSLIWARFVASQMNAAVYDTMNVTIEQNGVSFKANGSKQKFDGFIKVYKYAKQKDNALPDLNVNDEVLLTSTKPDQHFTQPPARYTEASLIKALEENGIGRPSTYAPTLQTIQKRNYVRLDAKKFVPTELGELVQDILVKQFPDITDMQFTAKIEKELDDVEVGKKEWVPVIDEFYKPFAKEVVVAEEELEKVVLHDELAGENCDICGAPLIVRMGRYGKFYACSRYPDCRNTKTIVDELGIDCPKCKKGQIIARKTKKGRTFYGCSRYPECDFVSWEKPKAENEQAESKEKTEEA